MVEAEITYFDLAVYIIVGLSSLIAFLRGFLKEILSLGAWIGAALITLYWAPDAIAYLEPHIERDYARYILGTLIVFFGSFIIIAFINGLLLRYAKKTTEVGVFDNILGAMFGAFRGAFVVSLGYLVISYLYTPETMPETIKNSTTQEYAKAGARLLVEIAPEHLVEESMEKRDDAQDIVGGAQKIYETQQNGGEGIDLQQLLPGENSATPPDLENLDDSDIINYLKETKEKLDNSAAQNINPDEAGGLSPQSREDLERVIESFDFEDASGQQGQ